MESCGALDGRERRFLASMSASQIPDDVRRLIAERIDSIPELEALLLLREYQGRTWTAVDAGQRLYVSKALAAHVLAVLEQRGFASRNGDEYRYHPGSSELRAAVDGLASAYSHHLVSVTELVHTKPSATVRYFADAFRLRRDK